MEQVFVSKKRHLVGVYDGLFGDVSRLIELPLQPPVSDVGQDPAVDEIGALQTNRLVVTVTRQQLVVVLL